MAFDQTTRNRLQRFVADARNLLTLEFTRQMQNEYGMDPASGSVSPLDSLHLDDSRLDTARILRDTLDHYRKGSATSDDKQLLEQITREQAFTVLNRFAALKMAEARGILIESLDKGYESQGFQLYQSVAGTGLGETGEAYKTYLFSIFDEFAVDLKVLFDRFSPTGLLFPKETVMLELLALVNDPEIDPLWAEDETIGWIYQYFNTKEERKKMRDESAAPRNSRELAVRNQFFTPRYVVEFLTDNTLGRTWYEMTKGQTSLANDCRYLVRRPNEVFLEPGQNAPETENEQSENLSQEELLKQTVYIPHRPLKDPREILMLDPACGSMHFGLYAFDLFLKIYEEAWELSIQPSSASGLKPLRETYEDDKERFLLDVPRLIIENNIHGVDIDPRAVQIAGLSLWLRAQRAWAEQDVKAADRPQIRRSNIVCAEPMPGEADLLEEFIAKHFADTAEKRLLGEFVRRIFDSMQLAGEAGSLLMIEEEVADLISDSREKWRKLQEKGGQKPVLFDYAPVDPQQKLDLQVGEITDANFWDRAESEIYKALRRYSEGSEHGAGYQRRMFADDAAQGFALIDLFRQRYDVVVMNPPFAESEGRLQEYLKSNYSKNWTNLYSAFIERSQILSTGRAGFVSPENFLSAYRMKNLREEFLRDKKLDFLVCLGNDVFDDMGLSTVAMTIGQAGTAELPALYSIDSATSHFITPKTVSSRTNFVLTPSIIQSESSWNEQTLSPDYGVVTKGNCTFDDFRFVRTWWEAPPKLINRAWHRWQKGGDYQPFFSSTPYVMDWNVENDGAAIRAYGINKVGTDAQVVQSSRYWWKHGLVGPALNTTGAGFNIRVLPRSQIFSAKSTVIITENEDDSFFLLSLLNAKPLRWCLYQQGAGLAGNTGRIKQLPIVELDEEPKKRLINIAREATGLMQMMETFNETSPFFNDCLRKIEPIIQQYKTIAQQNEEMVAAIYTDFKVGDEVRSMLQLSDAAVSEASGGYNENPIGHCLFSYLVGVAFGRWDLQGGLAPESTRELPEPFAPIPVCPPGMLQNADGLPAAPSDVSESYPAEIAWNGVLVDDAGNANDIGDRLQNILQIIWKELADSVETAACGVLGVRTLRDYFQKPLGFFAAHLKRYSKSRRQAPIYLPLSTTSGDYTLWLYYHRLTDQTLFSCINDFVEPKIRQVKDDVNGLSSKSGRSSNDEKRLAQLTDLSFELEELRDELLRLARIWKPNLNDGVQITMSPLWKLFRLPKWRKTLEDTWKKLEKGEYDWAHLAYSLWPDRVREKCKKDKSLAIAHDLEDLYEEPPATKKKKGKKAAADQKEMDLE